MNEAFQGGQISACIIALLPSYRISTYAGTQQSSVRINQSRLLYSISYMYAFMGLRTPKCNGDLGNPITAISRNENTH